MGAQQTPVSTLGCASAIVWCYLMKMRKPQSASEIEKLKQALSELRDNRARFSTESFAYLSLILMDRLRDAQTRTVEDIRQTDEVRLVTVMFVDVENSTELAQQMDASDWKNVLGEAHRRLATVITDWGGQIGQYLGDGLLSFFGARRSGGDDAVRAVSCALTAQAVIGNYADDVFLEHGILFGTRIGISTGRLVVGLIGDENKQELLALGPATNLAARLQSLAPPSGIVVDDSTHSRVRNHFVMQAQPPMSLKGYKTPVKYFKVLERRVQRVTRFTDDTINGITVPIYGRDAALATIGRVLTQATAQNAFHALTITGDIGIGKSRVLQEVLQTLPADTFTPVVMIAHYERRTRSHNLLYDLLFNACNLSDDMQPERIHTQILAHFTSLLSGPDAVTAAEIIGYLAGFGFDDSPHVQPLKRGRREGLAFAWVARWLRALARGRTLLLVVDNLQWADYASVALLEYLAREASVAGVLLAAGRSAYRAEHPQYMAGFERHQLIALDQLSPSATERLIRTVLQYVQRSPDWLAAAINERAEGNPLFVREFLGMLFDSGVFEAIESDEATTTGAENNSASPVKMWRFNRINYDERELPNGLIGVLQARLDDLAPDARHIIQLGAVVGQSFWDSIVSELAGLDARPLLETLVVRGIILKNAESVFEREGQYTFRHTLYRDVAYEMMPRAMREAYHAQVAHWLIMQIPGKPEYFPVLAHHFHQGGDHEAALFTLLEAAQSRLERGLLSETLLLTDRGRDVARHVTREEALPTVSQLWELRARAFVGLNRYDEATADSQAALDLLNELPDEQYIVTRVLAARTMGIAYRSLGRYQDAFTALSLAYDLLPDDEADPPLLSAVLRAFGVLCLYQGQLDESKAFQQRAYTFAQMTGQDNDLTGSMTQLGSVAFERGNIAQALGYFEQLLQVNRRRDFVYFQIADMRNIGQVYLYLRNYEQALTVLDDAYDLQQSIGTEDMLLQACLGLCLLHMGREAEGLPLLNDAVRQGERDVYHTCLLELVYLDALRLTEQYERCRERAVAFVAQVESTNKLLFGRGLLRLARVERALGGNDAPELLRRALALETEYGGRDTWVIYEALADCAAYAPPTSQSSQGDAQSTQSYITEGAYITEEAYMTEKYYSTEEAYMTEKYYMTEAAKRLRNIGSNLRAYPDLQVAFLGNETIKRILRAGHVS